jgi:type I restriction enzyme S subunit
MSELPPGWIGVSLGELVSPESSTVMARGSRLPYLGLEHVEAHSTAVIGTGDSASIKSAVKPFEPGFTLYARLRPYLNKVCAPEFEGVASTEFIVFKQSTLLSPRYLLYLLNHHGFVSYANQNAEGIERPRLSWARMAEYPTGLPPLNEQRRIVAAIEEHLSRLDAANASLAAALRRLDGLREASLSAAVNGSWPETPLGDLIVSLRNGVFVSRPAAEPPGTAIFRISAVRPLELNIDDVRYAPLDAPDYLVDEGDLLFTRYSGNPDLVGACALVPKLARPTLHPDKLIRVVVDRSRVEPTFVQIACATGRTREEIRARRKTTAGQVGIAGSQLKSVSVPVPPLEEQRRIVAEVEERLSRIDAMRASIERAQRRSKALRAVILERAFRGELVPQDPSDEPAEALLSRIRAEKDRTKGHQSAK